MKDNGVEDLGAFDEGACVKINSIMENVIVCFPSPNSVTKFM